MLEITRSRSSSTDIAEGRVGNIAGYCNAVALDVINGNALLVPLPTSLEYLRDILPNDTITTIYKNTFNDPQLDIFLTQELILNDSVFAISGMARFYVVNIVIIQGKLHLVSPSMWDSLLDTTTLHNYHAVLSQMR